MAEKARLFGDNEMRSRTLAEYHPLEQKKLGQKVRQFDDQVWDAHRLAIVTAGNRAKFQQNPELRDILLATGTKRLAEASPIDRIWGIGMSADEASAVDP